MDIYEFTRALGRHWRLLVVGFLALLVGTAAMVLEVSPTGVRYRVTPKYESTARMVVVPADLESLATPRVAGGFPGPATIYAELLKSEEAARQIEEAQGIDLLGTLAVGGGGDTSFITVTATSDTPEGAIAGALGAFRWLEGRLADPPVVAQVPSPEGSESLGEEPFLGEVLLLIDRAYMSAQPDVTLVVGNADGVEFAVPLHQAAEGLQTRLTYLQPETPLTMSIEREVGIPLDSVTVAVPPLPDEISGSPPTLVVSIETGGIDLGFRDAHLEPARIGLRWDGSPGLTAGQAGQPLSLLLVTQQPTATLTGQRRAPVVVLAMLGGGTLALLVLVTTVDTWQRAREEQRWLRQHRPEPPHAIPGDGDPESASGRESRQHELSQRW